MRRYYFSALTLFSLFSVCSSQDMTGRASLVDILSVDSTIILDIRYATANNFTGTVLYPSATAKLRKEAAESLAAVQKDLRAVNLGLKIFDAYRPLSIQWKLWKAVPNEKYVAHPRKGSKHNRGAAVDLTIVDAEGNELEMPTGYDDFSDRAGHAYDDLPDTVKRNRALLKEVMRRHGFHSIPSEWWHYDFMGWETFEIMDEPF